MSKAIETAVAKFAIAFVAVAMLFSLVAPAANAQTTDELQQMINDLLAQVSTLQGQLGGDTTSVAAGVCPYTWTRSLGQGDSGMDVMKLQQFLNADAETMVSASGVGSAGMESEYYGALTAAAVSKFQAKYRADILTPSGLVNPTGYFGPSSMAKANGLCVAAPVVTPVDDMDDMDDEDMMDDEDDDDTSSSAMSDDEASFDNFDMSDGDDTDLEEGQENAPVAEVEFDVEDGDVKINRIDVAFNTAAAGSEEDEPWDTFETVSIWVDGDMVAEIEADDEDEYTEDDPNTGDYKLRFTGLNLRYDEGDTVEFTIAVSLQTSIDSADTTIPWNVFVPTDGIRARDGAGVDQYTGLTSDDVSFDISEEGGDDELKIQSSSNDPDSEVFSVEDNTNSDWFTVFVFDLDTDDSVNDIVVETMVVSVQTGTENFEDVVNDAQLVIDGEEYDDYTVSGEDSTYATLTFDIDKDLEIEAGDEVQAELQLEFKKLDGVNYNQGETVQATTTATGWEAEGVDDVTPTGSATGEVHSLRTQGIILEAGTHDFDTQGTNDTIGVFKIVFEVEAFESDMYIVKNATSAALSATNGGAKYTVTDGGTTPTSISAALSSTADLSGGVYVVREGETETFTMTVTVDAGAAGLHSVSLDDVWFSDDSDGLTSGAADPVDPSEDYEILDESINQ